MEMPVFRVALMVNTLILIITPVIPVILIVLNVMEEVLTNVNNVVISSTY